MSKYNYFQKNNGEPKNELHPVWRGIGLIIMVMSPIISWAAAMVFVDYGKFYKWPFITQMSGTVRFSDIFYTIPLVSQVANYLSSIPYLIPIVVFFIMFLILFSGLFSFINAVLYRTFGPPRYSDLDAPAQRVRTKRYKR